MSAETVTLADLLAELRALRIEVRELRHQADNPTRPGARLVDASTLAGELNVSRAWVYEHRDELGAVSLGSGSKPRLRFDLERARRALGPHRTEPEPRKPTSRRSRGNATTGTILKIRDAA